MKNVEKKKTRVQDDKKVLMITNGSPQSSDDETDQFDRAFFTMHNNHHVSFMTRSSVDEPARTRSKSTATYKVSTNSTGAYEQQLSDWTEPTAAHQSQRAVRRIAQQTRTDRRNKSDAARLELLVTEPKPAAATDGNLTSDATTIDEASEVGDIPSLCAMSSDSESGEDWNGQHHGGSTEEYWSETEPRKLASTIHVPCDDDKTVEPASTRHPDGPSDTSGSRKTSTHWVMAEGPNIGKVYYNIKTLKINETIDGVITSYRGYKSVMAARNASDTLRQTRPTSHVSYDNSQHPFLNLSISKVTEDHLVVRESIYRAVNDHGWVVPVGRGLTCTSDIDSGAEIAVFKGVPITEASLDHLPSDQRGYVIDLSSGRPQEPDLINCHLNTSGDRPECLASMANDPSGLYNRLLDVSLHPEDANAAVAIVRRDDRKQALLYSIRHITSGEEVLWSYNARDDPQPDQPHRPPPCSSRSADPGTTVPGQDTEGMGSMRANPSEDVRGVDSHRANPATSHDPINGAPENAADSTQEVATGTDNHDADGTDSNGGNHSGQIRGVGSHRANPVENHDHTRGAADTASNLRQDRDSYTGGNRGVTDITANLLHIFDENHVTLDSASTTHVCMSPLHATSTAACPPGRIAGLGVTGEAVQYTDDCVLVNRHLGRAAFVPSAVANIISMSKARNQGTLVSYDCTPDQFSLTTTDGKLYVFGRAVSEHGVSSFYNMDISTSLPPTSTILDTRRRSTDVENSDADLAMSFIATLEHPCHCSRRTVSVSKNRAMIAAANIVGCPVKPNDIDRYFRVRDNLRYGETYETHALSRWTPPARVGQTAKVDIMTCEGYTYLVTILMPMEFSWCIEITRSATVAHAIDQIVSECNTQEVIIDIIETGADGALLNMEVGYASVLHGIPVAEHQPRAYASRAESRMREIKSAQRYITSHLDNPILRHITRHVAIEANLQINRRRSSSTGHRPHEEFMHKRMVYSDDVGLQIGDPCIGIRPDGCEHAGVYLYPQPMTGTHLTYHMEDGTTEPKRSIAPTTKDNLWASVHELTQVSTFFQRNTTHRVMTTIHTVGEAEPEDRHAAPRPTLRPTGTAVEPNTTHYEQTGVTRSHVMSPATTAELHRVMTIRHTVGDEAQPTTHAAPPPASVVDEAQPTAHAPPLPTSLATSSAVDPPTVPVEPHRSATHTTASSELDVSHQQSVHQDVFDDAGIRIIPFHERSDAYRRAVVAALFHNCNNPITETTFRLDHFLGTDTDDADGSN